MTNLLSSLHCPNCGNKISEADHLCPHCGIDLDAPLDKAELEALAGTYLEKAKHALEHGANLKGALDDCDQAIVYTPESAEAHNLRGLILDGLGRTGESILAYREALRLDPDFAEAQANLASAEAETRQAPPTNGVAASHPPKKGWADKILVGVIIGMGLCLLAGGAIFIYLVGKPYLADLTTKNTVIFQPDTSRGADPSAAQVKEAAQILTQRWAALGYASPTVSFTAAKNGLVVGRIPKSVPVEFINRTKALGLVEFVDFGQAPILVGTAVNTDYHPDFFPRADGATFKTIMTNVDVKSASVTTSQSGQYEIAFNLTTQGTKILADFTSQHIGNYLGITVDKIVIVSPKISSAITGGEVVIQGSFTVEEAQNIAAYLKTATLPYPFK